MGGYEWNCHKCTFLHKAPGTRCSMCGELRVTREQMRDFVLGKGIAKSEETAVRPTAESSSGRGSASSDKENNAANARKGGGGPGTDSSQDQGRRQAANLGAPHTAPGPRPGTATAMVNPYARHSSATSSAMGVVDRPSTAPHADSPRVTSMVVQQPNQPDDQPEQGSQHDAVVTTQLGQRPAQMQGTHGSGLPQQHNLLYSQPSAPPSHGHSVSVTGPRLQQQRCQPPSDNQYYSRPSYQPSTVQPQPLRTAVASATNNVGTAKGNFSQSERNSNNPFAIAASNGTRYKVGPVPLCQETMSSWIYPLSDKYPIREYQLNISHSALMQNTLVSLPTGLGKTLIAAVVMYNFYRWFPDGGKVIFCAPTRPLVTQQIEACYNIMGIPARDTAEISGRTKPSDRSELWSSRRVFFCTPQTLQKDIGEDRLDAKSIVCIVLDEAHKARGEYAYTKVVNQIEQAGAKFRVVGLSATPGTNIKAIQEVVDALRTSKIEARLEDDPNVKTYIHQRQEEIVLVKQASAVTTIERLFNDLIHPLLERLRNENALNRIRGGSATITPYCIMQAHREYVGRTRDNRLDGYFYALQPFVEMRSALNVHGVGVVRMRIARIMTERKGGVLGKIVAGEQFKALWGAILKATSGKDKDDQEEASDLKLNNPKLQKLDEILVEHFERKRACNESSRAIVFSQWRDSVEEIVTMLKSSQPLLQPRKFVGQGRTQGNRGNKQSSANSSSTTVTSDTGVSVAGMKQKEQQEVLRQFRLGTFNVLVCTCIGEEGLDIGEVDLIVNFDCLRSPIRMIQRTGRTGRKRAGRVVCLVAEGQEEQRYKNSVCAAKTLGRALKDPTKFNLAKNDPMFPRRPSVQKQNMSIETDYHLSQIGGHIRPAKKRSKKKSSSNGRPNNTGPPIDEDKWKLTSEQEKERIRLFGNLPSSSSFSLDVYDSSNCLFPTSLRRQYIRARQQTSAGCRRGAALGTGMTSTLLASFEDRFRKVSSPSPTTDGGGGLTLLSSLKAQPVASSHRTEQKMDDIIEIPEEDEGCGDIFEESSVLTSQVEAPMKSEEDQLEDHGSTREKASLTTMRWNEDDGLDEIFGSMESMALCDDSGRKETGSFDVGFLFDEDQHRKSMVSVPPQIDPATGMYAMELIDSSRDAASVTDSDDQDESTQLSMDDDALCAFFDQQCPQPPIVPTPNRLFDQAITNISDEICSTKKALGGIDSARLGGSDDVSEQGGFADNSDHCEPDILPSGQENSVAKACQEQSTECQGLPESLPKLDADATNELEEDNTEFFHLPSPPDSSSSSSSESEDNAENDNEPQPPAIDLYSGDKKESVFVQKIESVPVSTLGKASTLVDPEGTEQTGQAAVVNRRSDPPQDPEANPSCVKDSAGPQGFNANEKAQKNVASMNGNERHSDAFAVPTKSRDEEEVLVAADCDLDNARNEGTEQTVALFLPTQDSSSSSSGDEDEADLESGEEPNETETSNCRGAELLIRKNEARPSLTGPQLIPPPLGVVASTSSALQESEQSKSDNMKSSQEAQLHSAEETPVVHRRTKVSKRNNIISSPEATQVDTSGPVHATRSNNSGDPLDTADECLIDTPGTSSSQIKKSKSRRNVLFSMDSSLTTSQNAVPKTSYTVCDILSNTPEKVRENAGGNVDKTRKLRKRLRPKSNPGAEIEQNDQMEKRERIQRRMQERKKAASSCGFLDFEAGIDSDDDADGDADEELAVREIEEDEQSHDSFINDSSQLGYSTQDALDLVDGDDKLLSRSVDQRGQGLPALHRELDNERARLHQFSTPVFNRRMKRRLERGDATDNLDGLTPMSASSSSQDGLGRMNFIRSVIEHHKKGGEANAIEEEYHRISRQNVTEEKAASFEENEGDQAVMVVGHNEFSPQHLAAEKSSINVEEDSSPCSKAASSTSHTHRNVAVPANPFNKQNRPVVSQAAPQQYHPVSRHDAGRKPENPASITSAVAMAPPPPRPVPSTSNGSVGLTAEQRAMIEAKRQEALRRRQQRIQNQAYR